MFLFLRGGGRRLEFYRAQQDTQNRSGLKYSYARHKALDPLFAFHVRVRPSEAVSKLVWSGLSALDLLFRFLPGASPQADIDRAFGPIIS